MILFSFCCQIKSQITINTQACPASKSLRLQLHSHPRAFLPAMFRTLFGIKRSRQGPWGCGVAARSIQHPVPIRAWVIGQQSIQVARRPQSLRMNCRSRSGCWRLMGAHSLFFSSEPVSRCPTDGARGGLQFCN
jgi:hypothetical protein